MLIRKYSWLVKNMASILGNKVIVAQKIVGKNFLAKGFFVNVGVYFQNVAIRNCDYQLQLSLKNL